MTDDKLIESFMDKVFISLVVIVCAFLAFGIWFYWRWLE